MTYLSRETYNKAVFLAGLIRIYCCGLIKTDIPTPQTHNPPHTYNTHTHHTKPQPNISNTQKHIINSVGDNLMQELTVMQQSHIAVFYYADRVPAADTLLAIGYGVMCPSTAGIVVVSKDHHAYDIIRDMANIYNYQITDTFDNIKY